jgi:hypothetical protein
VQIGEAQKPQAKSRECGASARRIQFKLAATHKSS